MRLAKLVSGMLLGVFLSGWLLMGEQTMGGGDAPSAEKTRRVELEIVVNASLDDVWRAWTTNEGVRSFFSERANVRLAIGGPFEMFFVSDAPKGQQGSEGCKILSYLPKEMLSFSWNAPPKFAHARGRFTWVVLRFEELSGSHVRVKLSHIGWREMKTAHPDHADEWDQVYEYFSAAWPRVLDNLKKRFDDGPRWG